jgi:hypothetical protein
MQNRTDFAVFILTNKRAHSVATYKTLKSHGYTGKIYLMVDDEDAQLNDYLQLYGDEVVVFPKSEAIKMTDSGDNFNKRNSVVYARNYNFKVANDLGIKYFLQLDDDYTNFWYTFDNKANYLSAHVKIKNLDVVIDAMLEFFIESNATSIAMSQSGDFIGGENCTMAKLEKLGKFSRKVMNSFFCSTDRPFKFMGRINEDVNAYVVHGRAGNLFATVPRIRLKQKQTQANSGGLTDIYLDLGTYVKSFYSVIYAPSCVTIAEMGVTHRRLHHKIKWKNACPVILDAKHKKVNHAQ